MSVGRKEKRVESWTLLPQYSDEKKQLARWEDEKEKVDSWSPGACAGDLYKAAEYWEETVGFD